LDILGHLFFINTIGITAASLIKLFETSGLEEQMSLLIIDGGDSKSNGNYEPNLENLQSDGRNEEVFPCCGLCRMLIDPYSIAFFISYFPMFIFSIYTDISSLAEILHIFPPSKKPIISPFHSNI